MAVTPPSYASLDSPVGPTTGPRRHDDAADYEHDHEQWSLPGRLGYRIVLATWAKVTREPYAPLAELTATLAA